MGRMLSALSPRLMETGPVDLKMAPADKMWKRGRDADNVEWLLLDMPGRSVNVVDEAMLTELDAILTELEANPPKALAIRSAKKSGFIVGADINMFRNLTKAEEVEAALRRAHKVVDRLAAVPYPTVAVIHGNCLGGGLEIALACKRRVAVGEAKLGFPEVMLGLHPGLGGTFRSTELIDPTEAMTMMLTGRNKSARSAKRLGLVDLATEERHVAAAVAAVAKGELHSAAHEGLKDKALSSGPGRRFASNRMRAKVEERLRKEHYPAPYALIDLWETSGGDVDNMREGEIKSFADLLVTDTAQSLIRVFFLREKMKGLAPKKSDIGHVHVVGAGIMGGEIAAWSARSGMRATLADLAIKPIAKAMKPAWKMMEKTLKDSVKARDAWDRLIPDPNGYGLKGADLVIEAVPEKLDLKKKIYAGLEEGMKPGAIIATNTSSIPLEDLRADLKDPSRFVGIHFFNPVSKMQLVEVVKHDRLSDETLSAAMSYVTSIDRLPAPVKSSPGFLVNRALTPYLLEAMLLLDEGVDKEVIDEAAKDFGMPMGPVELMDNIGLDVGLAVADELRNRLPVPIPEAPQWLKDKVEKGELGRKTGKGLYSYDKDGKPQRGKKHEAIPPADLQDRLVLPILNTCAACLRENVVEDEDVLDGAMIFGTGFAPFRGGPLHYARARGVDDVVAALDKLAEKYGDRFKPDDGWTKLRQEQRAAA
ncbi:3-hydroxyacyl-CoA dehydrogenase NAD-binding domain-containing protein [Afifella sp. H1R]|uniref:3-hydroxyacyl-CoA dehydrogenase NAD-binding domain-containing protein n=1 Tax=Afifella sp. H1R TaxID=2908841 RepID=UPI001F1B02DD|nr:3-hydroxyacyl-CoA dehydrogenase NAD-binding domain-containing protein [Afifella sp. H1R]MCF1505761.1 3-hydroxyacyl-CoA dehydrogenase NAD-binding domain-containing protein [Afifella sp. H1R]